MAGMALKDDIFDAVLHGSISASYIIQQYGLPYLEPGTEQWGTEPPLSPTERLQMMKAR
jgi:hypothetical protein